MFHFLQRVAEFLFCNLEIDCHDQKIDKVDSVGRKCKLANILHCQVISKTELTSHQVEKSHATFVNSLLSSISQKAFPKINLLIFDVCPLTPSDILGIS